ncbi:Lysophospholipase L1 [Sporobacter termitidis DSM 10068]|uniref:Lysophospholipase L1 n=1 Tax=Sporobacter termitidis DSM 10068 TaxID=1123282 RepID=A0A1M5YFA7_9FIRM|nr:GDSL-type esterase/lipase family protein [Sporobacter termitidis]SHI10717.1 Lysophospholipase L1 [Sporobacter termitidis DSM 10068]
MKRTAKSIVFLVLALALPALACTPGLAAGAPGTINYVAFGDSVSAGVRGGVGAPGSEPGSDKGYTDDIAGLLKDAGVLGGFNEDYCLSGETAKGLAQKTEALRDASSPGAALVRNADIITVDVGANDLLGPLYAYAGTLKSVTDYDLDKAAQILKQMIDELYGATGAGIQADYETILRNMLAANDGVRIFVMGYYNPLPVASALAGVDLDEPTAYLNTLIQTAIAGVQADYPGASISYVPTFDAMAAAPDSLVATDIHPTESGYTVIAGEFWKQLKPLADGCQVSAAVSPSRFIVNGQTLPFGAYIIDDSNYIKLRDAAMALNGTPKQIGVSWDGATDTVTVTSGAAYAPVGGELAPIQCGMPAKALLSKSAVVMDGNALRLTVYNIGGNNYIRLRELAAALDIGVSWDGGTNTVTLDAAKGGILPAA